VTTAFVLGGGGILGASEVGMVQALQEHGVTADLIRDLAWQMRGFDESELYFHTMGLAGFGRSDDGQSILVTDPAATERLAASLRTDTMETYVE